MKNLVKDFSVYLFDILCIYSSHTLTINLNIFILQIIREVATPMCETKKITMVSSGSGEIGAAKLADEVLAIATKVPDLVKTMTGIDIAKVTARAS